MSKKYLFITVLFFFTASLLAQNQYERMQGVFEGQNTSYKLKITVTISSNQPQNEKKAVFDILYSGHNGENPKKLTRVIPEKTEKTNGGFLMEFAENGGASSSGNQSGQGNNSPDPFAKGGSSKSPNDPFAKPNSQNSQQDPFTKPGTQNNAKWYFTFTQGAQPKDDKFVLTLIGRSGFDDPFNPFKSVTAGRIQ